MLMLGFMDFDNTGVVISCVNRILSIVELIIICSTVGGENDHGLMGDVGGSWKVGAPNEVKFFVA